VGHGGTDLAELYDPAVGKFTPIGKMTSRRGRPSATLLPTAMCYRRCEESDNESLASAEIFRATTLLFQPTGSMHYARVSHTATLLNDGRVLIAGSLRGLAFQPARNYTIQRPALSLRAAVWAVRAANT